MEMALVGPAAINRDDPHRAASTTGAVFAVTELATPARGGGLGFFHTGAVVTATRDIEGVVRAHPAGTSEDGTLVKIMVTSEYLPSSQQSLEQIGELRDAVHAVVGSNALVGGAVRGGYRRHSVQRFFAERLSCPPA